MLVDVGNEKLYGWLWDLKRSPYTDFNALNVSVSTAGDALDSRPRKKYPLKLGTFAVPRTVNNYGYVNVLYAVPSHNKYPVGITLEYQTNIEPTGMAFANALLIAVVT